MDALGLLQFKIKQSFSDKLRSAVWGQPQLMSKALEEVCSVFDSPIDPAPKRSVNKTLMSFRRSKRLPTFLDLKYTCHGITQQAGEDDWRLIEDIDLFPLLLKRVDLEQCKPRRFLKCYQGLLSGYFDYNIYADNIPERGRNNWKSLRMFLHDRLHRAQQVLPLPNWVKIISKHADLLTEDLCDGYGEALAQGDYRGLKSALEGLLIPRNSWVWEATVLARIKAICVFDDDTFKKHLDPCLAMLSQSKIALSEIQKKRCLAQLVSRYAKCSSMPEHAALLDTAVMLIGNPLIDRTAWDAFVRDEDAHGMINRWFKRRLITDFFRILSEDGPVDSRRLRYWLRFEPRIDDMWFALGPCALDNPGEDFRVFRKIAHDRILLLENGGLDINNALIMRIDEYVFVEFSMAGHTCLVFKNNDLPFDLDKKWIYIGSRPSEEKLNGKGSLKCIDYT